MSLFNLISGLAGDRERETADLMKQHVEMTSKAVIGFKKAFRLFKEKEYGSMEDEVEEISSIESKADGLRRQIEENMYSGAFLPGSRHLIFNFSETVDKVADAAEDAARILGFLKEKDIPEDLITLLEIELEDGLDSIETLKNCMANLSDVGKVKSAIDRVREKEHESDEIADKTYSALYKKISDPITILLVSTLIKYIGDISDRAEDATDALSLMMLLHKA